MPLTQSTIKNKKMCSAMPEVLRQPNTLDESSQSLLILALQINLFGIGVYFGMAGYLKTLTWLINGCWKMNLMLMQWPADYLPTRPTRGLMVVRFENLWDVQQDTGTYLEKRSKVKEDTLCTEKDSSYSCGCVVVSTGTSCLESSASF